MAAFESLIVSKIIIKRSTFFGQTNLRMQICSTKGDTFSLRVDEFLWVAPKKVQGPA